MNENTVQNPKRAKTSVSLGELLKIVRVVKLRPTYLEGVSTLSLKTIDLSKIREKKLLNEKRDIEKLEKMARGNDSYRKMLKVFAEKYKDLTGSKFSFKKKRIITVQDDSGNNSIKLIESDAKRLSAVFKQIQSKSDNNRITAIMLEEMMDKWADWDKASQFNLIGFLQKQASEDEIGTYFMKARKKTKVDKSSALKEDKRVENVERHRQLFASA
jgi:hypothetical protein